MSTLTFSQPAIKQYSSDYIEINFDGISTYLTNPGQPVLPEFVKSVELPFGAKNVNVEVTPNNVKEYEIDREIRPAPAHVLLVNNENSYSSTPIKDEELYASDTPFPSSWYSYKVGCGLNANNERVTFVSIHIYPTRYTPASGKLYVAESADIKTSYEPGYQPTNYLESYDMVIIAPAKFSSALQPLVTHKNDYGVKTILKTTESIYSEFSGRDTPEQIKYFIKYAKETWGITYVLLCGGLKSYFNAKDRENTNYGSKDWWVPVRYTHIPEDDGHGCISDLYYGDIYRYNITTNLTEFEDWDLNGNSIFAEWSGTKKDKLDLVPDVYYGRLACVNINEVTLIVNKIINYEKTTPASKSWLKTMIGIGGKTFGIYQGQPDGEYVCNLSISYMGSLVDNPIRVYATNNNTGKPIPIPTDIVNAITGGAGYVNFEGHGNPLVWNCIWADGEYEGGDWVGGISVVEFKELRNGDKLPVVIVGGCHNALFNVSILQAMRSGNRVWPSIPILKRLVTPSSWYWTYGTPAPRCFSWWLLTLAKGGAIASTGCTGYGMGPGSGDPNQLSAEMETNFFDQIGQNGSTNLGSAHSGSIRKYVLDNGVPQSEVAHCLTVYELFGDPSLKLGGYE